MNQNIEDSELVAAIVGGDPRPWGDVFDRHRDRVWQVAYSITRRRPEAEDVVQSTFLKAVESIGQLRDTAKLRPWLLAIARRLALDSVGTQREIAYDPLDQADGWADTRTDRSGVAGPVRARSLETADPDEMISGVHREEMTRLVVAAFDGLEPRDRVALELTERQGLGGDELAESLGVSRNNAYALVHNARARFASSVTSLVIARHGRGECGGLDALLDGWDGGLTPLLRKRVTRHVKGCDTCRETKRRQVSPAVLVALLPVVAMSSLAVDQSKAAAMEAAGAGPAISSGSSIGATNTATAVGAIAGTKIAAIVALAIFVGSAGLAIRSGPDGSDKGETATATTMTTTPSTSQPTTTPTIQATTTGPPAGATFCEVSDLLYLASHPGPASAEPDDIRTYFTTVNALVQQLVVTAGPDADENMIAYATAYQELVDAEIWDPAELPDSEQLAALADTVRTQLERTCGTP